MPSRGPSPEPAGSLAPVVETGGSVVSGGTGFTPAPSPGVGGGTREGRPRPDTGVGGDGGGDADALVSAPPGAAMGRKSLTLPDLRAAGSRAASVAESPPATTRPGPGGASAADGARGTTAAAAANAANATAGSPALALSSSLLKPVSIGATPPAAQAPTRRPDGSAVPGPFSPGAAVDWALASLSGPAAAAPDSGGSEEEDE